MKRLTLGAGLAFVAAIVVVVPLHAARSQKSQTTKPAKITFVGCLEYDSPLSSAAAANASQVTAFRLTGIDPVLLKTSAAAAGMDVNAATEVRLLKGDEFDLLDHLGRRVRVTGKFADRAVAPVPAGGTVVTAHGVVTWVPVIDVSSLHTVADTCR